MKRYKITLFVPHSSVIDAESAQHAHNEATALLKRTRPIEGDPEAYLYSIECVGAPQDDFDYPPPSEC